MSLNQQQRMLFAEIIFQQQGRQRQGIAQLNQDQISLLRKVYAQKIASDAVNTHIEPPPQYVPQITSRASIPGVISTLCCCLFPQDNRENFDIKSSEFISRVFKVFLFWRKDFISHGAFKSELYGPLWVTVTYIIVLGLAANLNNYFILPQNYTFNLQLMVYAIGLTVIFQIAQPLIYSAVIQCLGGTIPSNQSTMITGYSLMLYVIPTIFCMVPSLYWHIMMLGIAGLLRSIFLFRNYSVRLDSKTYIFFVVVLIIEALYTFILLRVLFTNNNGYAFSAGTQKVFHLTSLRNFSNDEVQTTGEVFTHFFNNMGIQF